jgi:hypothetical protein
VTGNDTSAALEVLAEAAAVVAAAYQATVTGGAEAVGWNTPYISATGTATYATSTTVGTLATQASAAIYAASTTRGVL